MIFERGMHMSYYCKWFGATIEKKCPRRKMTDHEFIYCMIEDLYNMFEFES